MVDHALHVGVHVLARVPAVAADDVQRVAGRAVGGAGQALLAGGVPLEDAVGGDLLVQYLRQRGHLQIFIVGNEAALVAIAALLRGEGHHVAALQPERAHAVVQLLVGHGHHVAAVVLQSEVVGRLALEVLLAIHREGFCRRGIGQDHCAARAVEAHLAVLVVLGCCTIDFHARGQQRADDLRGFHALDDEHGMLGVHDVHHALVGKGGLAVHHIVHIGGQPHGRRHLTDGLLGIGSRCRQTGGNQQQGKESLDLHICFVLVSS